MKHSILLSSLFFCLQVFSQKIKFSLGGNTFYKNGTARLFIHDQRRQEVLFDSCEIVDGKFRMSSVINEPSYFTFKLGTEEKTLLIGSEKIFISQTDSIIREVIVTGSQLTKDYEKYNNEYKQPVITAYIKIDSIIATLDSNNQKTIDSLRGIQAANFRKVPFQALEFVRSHSSSFLSLSLLNNYGDAYNVDTLKYYYTRLDKRLKGYPSAQFVQQKILLGSNKSAKSPRFSVLDTANKIVNLQSFKGNYLLIDFWASWCVPCVENIPFVQQAAVQFEHSNFKVLTVSMDNKEQAWKSALINYKLNDVCKNVLLPNTFRHPMALQFNISEIPTNILINPNGEIIAKNISGYDLITKLESVLSIKKN